MSSCVFRVTFTSVVAVVAMAGMAATPAGASGGAEGVPALSHVFVIVGENTQLSQLNMGNAPYLLGTLKPASAWLTADIALDLVFETPADEMWEAAIRRLGAEPGSLQLGSGVH